MMQALDQWAFGVLMALYSLLGIQDLPKKPNPDWTVVERWLELPDKSYRLILQSENLVRSCKQNKDAYIIFPQIYAGFQEVKIDDVVLYTNSMSRDHWALKTMFDRVFISCHSVESGRVITFTINSYQKFQSSISKYPHITKRYPVENFFYSEIYLLAAILCIGMGLVSSLISRGLSLPEDNLFSLSRDFVLGAFMLCYVPKYWAIINVKYLYFLTGLSMAVGAAFFLYPVLIINKSIKTTWKIGLILYSCAWVFTIGYKNMSLLLLICNSFISIIGFSCAAIVVVADNSKKYMKIEVFVFLLIAVMVIQDVYIAFISRDGFFHLGFLVIMLAMINFYKSIRAVEQKKAEAFFYKEKLESESKIVKMMSHFHEVYREIIHDLKSPISVINFMSKSTVINGKDLGGIAKRFSEIISRIQAEGASFPDWYPFELVNKTIGEIVTEKVIIKVSTNFNVDGVSTNDVFFNPSELKIILAELIDNSVKYGASTIVLMDTCMSEDHFCILVSDNGKGVSEKILDNIGLKGMTEGGTGMGLYLVKKKIEGMAGKCKFSSSPKGFSCEITLKARPSR